MLRKIYLIVLLLFVFAGLVAENASSASNSILISKNDLSKGGSFKTLKGGSGSLYAVVFSPDGKLVVSGTDDGTVEVWELSTGNLVRTLSKHSKWVHSVAYSPDGKIIASGSGDGTVKLWDPLTGKLLKKLKGSKKAVLALDFSPDGKVLASGSRDGNIRLWNLSTGRIAKKIKAHDNYINGLAFSPDGSLIATASGDDTAKIWNVSTGKKIRSITGHSTYVVDVSFSNDGSFLATASADNTAKLWAAATGRLIRTYSGHGDGLKSVAFSMDDKYLATAGRDNKVMLWNVKTGELLRTLSEHTGDIYSVAFSPDNKILASASSDDNVKLWDVEDKYGSLFKEYKKGEFEKTNSFNDRVAELRSRSLPYSMTSEFHSYDADMETYKVTINNKKYSVSVPIAKAKTIGADKTVKIEAGIRYYDDNNAELINPTVYHEPTGFKSRVLGFKKVVQKSFVSSSNKKNKRSASESEAMFWSSIEFSKDANDFKAYLKQYPSGAFVALAESKAGKYMKLTNKETLVLMPIKTTGIADDMRSSMESAVVEGLNNKYKVYAGSQVRKKVKEIFTKESKNTKAGKKCDETKCMQDIAIAFNCELIATSRVIKNQGGFVLSIDVRNIFDDVSVYSKSVPCKNCDEFQAIEKLKTLVK